MQQDTSSSASGILPEVADQEETIQRLRAENARLRSDLEHLVAKSLATSSSDSWTTAMKRGIEYSDGQSHTSSISAGRLLRQLSGISKERMKAGKIRNSNDFEYLPRPSTDETQLESDFVRWGYCLVQDAMSPSQIQRQMDRLVDQAQAERQLDSAIMTSRNDRAQLVNNLVLKGDVFRDIVEFKESAAQRGPLVDRLLTKIMGEGFGLGCAHGSIVHQGGGLQELHIDQGLLPLPYPPFPFGSLIIWCFTEFSLDNGATYIVPGSHRSSDGTTVFSVGANLVDLVDSEPGLVAICAPAGTCILTDTRVLHCGGRRTAPGTRYGLRCHYNRHFIRALHEQSGANHHVPDEIYALLSDRLKHMMGITHSNLNPIGELSCNDLSDDDS
ncbi:MAG: phytanoyl-CoA dioxygenase family protein [Gammaproteobacteria bacterium]|nr:phytanoyl-CoA dioxygenase family protein [Gammaproteobacteria bacterium]MYD80118.1 phytanoyl-CoA dioxygenase family protein [Gammaproteobacteria bacterium]